MYTIFPDSESKIDEIIAFAKAATAVEKLKRRQGGQLMGFRDMRFYGTFRVMVCHPKPKLGVEVEFFLSAGNCTKQDGRSMQ